MYKFSIVEKSFMVRYTKEVADYCDPFCCGDKDLDEFFKYDVFLYEEELLSKAFCWISTDNPREIVAIATLSFDGIKANTLDNSSRNALQRKIPYKKHHRSYPAVLIGRLGVNSKFQGQGLSIGTQLMDVLKHSFVDENNKAACRYMLVDAYNVESTLHYYFKNGFKPLYKSEESEKQSFGIPNEEELKSRILYFDLKFIDK
ncbi:MAG: GNAT family N-acetyltransferase [Muribaculaceae bacterium]|nr:GNAT family N-acetyltransferase [Muribaculaceae bacterium]